MSIKSAVFTLILFVATSITVFAQLEDRIIRAKPRSGDDSPVLQIVAFKIGARPIAVNEVFQADGNWLKDLKITVKNVGEQKISCLVIVLRPLEMIDYKIRTGESWAWGLPFGQGECNNLTKREKTDTAILKPGDMIELSYENLDALLRNSKNFPWETFHKAILGDAHVRFKNGEENDIRLALPPDAKYLDEPPY